MSAQLQSLTCNWNRPIEACIESILLSGERLDDFLRGAAMAAGASSQTFLDHERCVCAYAQWLAGPVPIVRAFVPRCAARLRGGHSSE
jgi:hypothetical protein